MTKVGTSEKKNTIWFPAKKFGWGWGLPTVWQGWAAYIGCLVGGLAPLLYVITLYKGDTYCKELISKGYAPSCNPDGMKGLYLAASFMWLSAMIMLLYIICSKKGEKPSWQWGKKKVEHHATKS